MSYWNERLHRAASFIRTAASPTFPAIPTASSADDDPGRSHPPEGLEDLRRILGEMQRELALLNRQQAERYELSRMMANVLPVRPVQILDTVPDNASSSDDSDDDTTIRDLVCIYQVQWFCLKLVVSTIHQLSPPIMQRVSRRRKKMPLCMPLECLLRQRIPRKRLLRLSVDSFCAEKGKGRWTSWILTRATS